ncbi:hypothetical protein BG011_007881 [Mortierella polycephala]|uniref:PPM-type phosphatase domain-containing protein n=1 Tax=Mortierella polycephala TaxID=41804 RepID=A0A9P6PQS6_9FUNG|nr:hypothetical protein BG011_007881 [Mortierella polycephala]
MKLPRFLHSDCPLISPQMFSQHQHVNYLHSTRGRLAGPRLDAGSPLQQYRTFSSSPAIAYAQPYFAMRNSRGDTLRVHLSKSRDFVGIRSTRCQRKYNQDRYKILVLNPPTLSPEFSSIEASSTASASASSATPSSGGQPNHNNNNHNHIKSTEGSQMDADQKTLFYFAIFDGHGGSNTADYLTSHLDVFIEQATPALVPKVIKSLRKLGGYFRSFRPHFLEPFLPDDFEKKHGPRKGGEQLKVHVKGKGGQIKPMIFIPHPNATEEEQEQDVMSLENKAAKVITKDKGGDHGTGSPTIAPAAPEKEGGHVEAKSNKEMNKEEQKEEEDEEDSYDEDEDPFVIARRRELNKTSPLPGGTTSYFSTNRSEYEQLTLKANDPTEIAAQEEHGASIPETMTLEQRLCLSFLECDTELIRNKYKDGSTASVVVVQSKGAFWETQEDLDLVLAHVGDTRVLLCQAPLGESIQLTTDHHPDAVVEADRIRKMAAYVSEDSFGENMFLGRLANTRALGDTAMKPFGVTAEPEIIRRTVKAKEAAFLVLMSDGVSSVMSNQEVVDCVKLEDNPTQAAANVLNLAEQLGAEDNCTILVVKLPAWGTPMPDLSKGLREYRWQSEALQARARRR